MSVIRESSSRVRARVAYVAATRALPRSRNYLAHLVLSSPLLLSLSPFVNLFSPFHHGLSSSLYRTFSKSYRNIEEDPGTGPRHQLCACKLQFHDATCPYGGPPLSARYYSTVSQTGIAHAFAFTQPDYRTPLLYFANSR